MALRLSDDIERVIILRPRSSGGGRTREVLDVDQDEEVGSDDGVKFVVLPQSGKAWRGVLQESLGPKKKQSKRLRPIERRVRKMAQRQTRIMAAYLTLHDISNRKKKNGWVRDLRKNLTKAIRKSS